MHRRIRHTHLTGRLRQCVTWLGGVLLAVLLVACVHQPLQPPDTSAGLAKEIVLYNWVDYTPQDVLDDFEREYGVHVRYVTFETMAEAVAAVRSGEQGLDVVVLEYDELPGLVAEGRLAQLDAAHIPNLADIAPSFRDLSWDPGNRYGAPNMWGTTGLVVRSDLLTKPATRWSDLRDTALAGRILVHGEADEVIGVALKSLGYSHNTGDPQELEAAERRLQALRPAVTVVGSELGETVPPLVSGEKAILVGWPGEAIEAQKGNPNIRYIFPEEGTLLWGDAFAVPITSQHKHTAEMLINYLLRPEVAARTVNMTYYATANGAAGPYIDPAIAANPAFRVSADEFSRGEWYLPVNKEGRQQRDAIWARFLSAETAGSSQ